MPMLVDHAHMQAEPVKAVWRVIQREGVHGASVRCWPAKQGCTSGPCTTSAVGTLRTAPPNRRTDMRRTGQVARNSARATVREAEFLYGGVIDPRFPESHRARKMAEFFGTDRERYDRARPRYPESLVHQIIDASPGIRLLDLGCGSGIAARHFRAAGCAPFGVEPDVRMAEFARERGLGVDVATFEAWDPDGRSFDAVISAQSWHWVDPVAGAVKAARVLRPGGRLAVFGHVFEPPDEVAEAFAATYRRLVPDSPFAHQPARHPLGQYQTT